MAHGDSHGIREAFDIQVLERGLNDGGLVPAVLKAQHGIPGGERYGVGQIPVRETGGGDADIGGQNVAVSS